MLVTEAPFEAHEINTDSRGMVWMRGWGVLEHVEWVVLCFGIVICKTYEFYIRTRKTANRNALL